MTIRLTALTVVLLCAGVLTAREKAKDGLPADLALVGDAVAFIRLDVGSAWNGAETDLLKKLTRSHPVILLWEGHGLEKSLGLKLEEIDRVVVIIRSYAAINDALAVVTTRKPFDRNKVLGSLVPGGKEMKVKDRSYFAGSKEGVAVHLLGKDSCLVGSVAGVKEFLAKAPGKAGVLADTLTAATKKPLLAIGLDPRGFAPAIEKAGEDAKVFLPLFQARSWQVIVQGGGRLTLNFRFAFADPDAAKAAVPAVKAALVPLDGYLENAEKQFPAFLKREQSKYKGVKDLLGPLADTIKATRAALKTFKPEQNGSVVQGSLQIQTKSPAAALLILSALAPRPAKDKE